MALKDNLVSYWKLDSGALTTDSAGSNTLTNNNTVGEGTAKLGTASADFGSSNTNKSFNVPNLGISGATSRTIACWIKTSANQGTIFSSGVNSADTAFHFGVGLSGTNNGKMEVSTWSGTGVISPNTIHDGNWHHVACTYNGGVANATNIKIYIDGIDSEATGGSGFAQNTTNSNYGIGYLRVSNSAYFSGMIDEVGVWSRALSSTEVAYLYNSGIGNQYPFNDSGFLALFL